MENLKKAVAKKEYNPREHRLLHGVRQKLVYYFDGKGKKLKDYMKKWLLKEFKFNHLKF